MATDLAIETAGYDRIQAMIDAGDIDADRVAWPAVDFVPPDSGIWLEVSHFPNEPARTRWSQEYRGFFQVMVGFRAGDGMVAAKTQAEAVIAQFPVGLALGTVRVVGPYVSPQLHDGDKEYFPVSIPYRGM